MDEGFLKKGSKIGRDGYGHYCPHPETWQQLGSHGDSSVAEYIYSDSEIRTINHGYMAQIRRKAEELVIRHPNLEEEVTAYIHNQEQECELIENEITGAFWIIRRK